MKPSGHSLYRLRALPRVVPWMSWEEWKQVYFWLFDQDPAIARQGLKRVAAWENRGKIPLSVEVTAKLIEAIVNDRERYVKFRTETEIRMLYAMAISRMVNGLVQIYQRSAFAISMASIAKILDLPNVLIEIRHNASHKELPLLSTLRLAAVEALKWLQTHYWERQLQHLEDLSETIRDVLKKYRRLQKQLTSSHFPAAWRIHFSLRRFKLRQLLNKFLKVVTPSQITSTVIPMLLDKNFLVPLPKDPSKAVAIPKILPRRLILMWSGFLKRLSLSWPLFLDTLLVTIVQRVIHTTKNVMPDKRLRRRYRSLLVCWYSFLINGFTTSPSEEISFHVPTLNDSAKNNTNCVTKPNEDPTDRDDHKREMTTLYLNKSKSSSTAFSSQILLTIIQTCLRYPNRWTARILQSTIPLLDKSGQRDAMKATAEEMLTLMNKFVQLKSLEKTIELEGKRISPLNNCGARNNEVLLEFEELQERLHQLNRSQKTLSREVNSEMVWIPCDDSVLSGLGHSVAGTLPDLTLPESLDNYIGSFVVLPSLEGGVGDELTRVRVPGQDESNLGLTESVAPLPSIPKFWVPFSPSFLESSTKNQTEQNITFIMTDDVELEEGKAPFNIEQLRDEVHLLFSDRKSVV